MLKHTEMEKLEAMSGLNDTLEFTSQTLLHEKLLCFNMLSISIQEIK